MILTSKITQLVLAIWHFATIISLRIYYRCSRLVFATLFWIWRAFCNLESEGLCFTNRFDIPKCILWSRIRIYNKDAPCKCYSIVFFSALWL